MKFNQNPIIFWSFFKSALKLSKKFYFTLPFEHPCSHYGKESSTLLSSLLKKTDVENSWCSVNCFSFLLRTASQGINMSGILVHYFLNTYNFIILFSYSCVFSVPICNSRTPTQCLLLSSRIIGKTRLHVMMQREHITKNCRGAR